MKNKILPLLLVAIFTLITGCEKSVSTNDSATALHFTINTKVSNGTKNNTIISCTRLIVVDKLTSRIIFNMDTDNGLNGQQESDGSRTFTLELKPGEYSTYVIANETEQMITDLNNALKLKDLKTIAISGSFDETTTPFSGSQDFRLRRKEGSAASEASIDNGITWNNNLEIELKRTQCKVSLHLRKKTGSTDEIKITKVELCNIPELSYLISKTYEPISPYTKNVFNNSTGITLDSDVADGEEELTSYTTIFDTGAIFPEKKMIDNADASKATYLKIYATYGTLQTTYTVKLRDNLTVANYDLTRNIHYKVYTTLKSAGEVSVIYFAPTWTVDEVSGDIEVPYLNVSNLNLQQTVTKDINGQLTPDGDLSFVYFFWTNRPASEIRVEWDEYSPDKLLSKAPVLTILKSTTTPDGVSDVAGKVEITVDKEWVKKNFHIVNSADSKACTLLSDKLRRTLNISLHGVAIANITAPIPTLGEIVATKNGSTYTATFGTFEITAFLDPNNMKISATTISYVGFAFAEKSKVLNPDGTALVTYIVTFSSPTYPRWLTAGTYSIPIKITNSQTSAVLCTETFNLTVKKSNF